MTLLRRYLFVVCLHDSCFPGYMAEWSWGIPRTFFSSWKQCVGINMREVFPGKLYSYQLKLKKDSTEESFCYDNIYDRLQTSGNSGDMYINLWCICLFYSVYASPVYCLLWTVYCDMKLPMCKTMRTFRLNDVNCSLLLWGRERE